MAAQLPHVRPDLTELRAVGAALLTRLAELRERDVAVPDELWRAAERFQPLLDGIDPEPDEEEALWELALLLPQLLGRVPAPAAAPGPPPAPEPTLPSAPVPAPPVALLVGDRVEHVETRGA